MDLRCGLSSHKRWRTSSGVAANWGVDSGPNWVIAPPSVADKAVRIAHYHIETPPGENQNLFATLTGTYVWIVLTVSVAKRFWFLPVGVSICTCVQQTWCSLAIFAMLICVYVLHCNTIIPHKSTRFTLKMPSEIMLDSKADEVVRNAHYMRVASMVYLSYCRYVISKTNRGWWGTKTHKTAPPPQRLISRLHGTVTSPFWMYPPRYTFCWANVIRTLNYAFHPSNGADEGIRCRCQLNFAHWGLSVKVCNILIEQVGLPWIFKHKWWETAWRDQIQFIQVFGFRIDFQMLQVAPIMNAHS